MPKRKVLSYLVCLFMVMLSEGFAAPFVPPQEGPVAFRRDRLPLDPETMVSLSEQLHTLAAAQRMDRAEDRRAVAQMLALALALNPVNPQARAAVNSLAEEAEALGVPDAGKLERSRSRIWNTLAWLETPEAGPDGNALAACLADVIAASDPGHPQSAAVREKGERGAWNSWIAPVDRFEEVKIAQNQSVTGKSGQEEPVQTVALKLEKAVISTPLWMEDSNTKSSRLLSVPVTLLAEPTGGDFTFSIEDTPSSSALAQMNHTLKQALEKEHGGLPKTARVTLICGKEENYRWGQNRNAISGAAAVLLSAAITGREPDATVIGLIEADGAFKAPNDFWDRLRSLMDSDAPGGKLVVPSEAADTVGFILALEQPEFFFKYEVMTASNLTELLDRSAKIPSSEIQDISVKFRDIREKGVSQPLSSYVANRFIRQRLNDLVSAAPYHLSAKWLAVQAAGERPTRLPRNLLAFEYQRAIAPMAWILNESFVGFDTERLDQTYETCRAEVDLLERYVDTADRDLHMRVRDLTTSMRTFSRGTRIRGAEMSGKAATVLAYDLMIRSYALIHEELAALTEPEDRRELPPP